MKHGRLMSDFTLPAFGNQQGDENAVS